jgi:hypothetical protein
MRTVKARFDGRVFVPEQPVDVPVGSVLEIPLAGPCGEALAPPPLAALLAALEQWPANPEWPADGAAQHDHYLCGTPKTP